MAINKMNGKIEGRVKISEVIEYMKEHQEVYGDTDIIFMIDGERDVLVEFDHYSNALTINIEEVCEEDEE